MSISDVPAYAIAWWAWWNVLQPSERLAPDRVTNLPPTYDMDWACLRKAGNNGLLLVVMALRWWGKASDASVDWREAASDFRQTLFCMLDGFRGQIAREAEGRPQRGSRRKKKSVANTDSVLVTTGTSTRASTLAVNEGKRKRNPRPRPDATPTKRPRH